MAAPSTLVIGNKNYSSWSLRAYLMLRHSGLPFEEHRLALDTNAFHQKIGAFSPTRQVPVLIHEELTIWDSLAIGEWLAEQYPSMWPSNSEARAFARCISAEMHAGFSNLRALMPMNCRALGRVAQANADLYRDIERIQAIWNEGRERWSNQGPWLCGSFCIADCMYAPVIFRFRSYGITLQGEAAQYAERMLEHPYMIDWETEARRETEIIEKEEVGAG